jgi:hypothetical protein
MKSIYFLEETNELEFDVLAINSHAKGYNLCWHINSALKRAFKRKDISLPDNEVFAGFTERKEGVEYTIIANKSKKGYLLSKQNRIDFFVKIEPRLSAEKKQEFIEKLNKISKILLIFELDLKKENEAHRFIFYD